MAKAPKPPVEPDACFLNIPYDDKFENLYLAYIVGLTAHGLVPRATLGVPRDARRLERIFKLIQTCRYSVHDLSRTQRDGTPPAPRFNMPFELGLAVWHGQVSILGVTPGSVATQFRTASSDPSAT